MAQEGRFPLTSGFAFRRRGAKGSMLLRQQILFQDRDGAEAEVFADWWLNAAPVEHSLSATGIVTGTPTVGTPTLEIDHALDATGIETGAPTVGTPTLTVDHALNSVGIVTGPPTVGAPTLSLEETPVTPPPPQAGGGGGGAMQLGRRKAGSGRWVRIDKDPEPEEKKPKPRHVDHALSVRSISTGRPTVGSPRLGVGNTFAAVGICAKPPRATRPSIRVIDDNEVLKLLEMLEAA